MSKKVPEGMVEDRPGRQASDEPGIRHFRRAEPQPQSEAEPQPARTATWARASYEEVEAERLWREMQAKQAPPPPPPIAARPAEPPFDMQDASYNGGNFRCRLILRLEGVRADDAMGVAYRKAEARMLEAGRAGRALVAASPEAKKAEELRGRLDQLDAEIRSRAEALSGARAAYDREVKMGAVEQVLALSREVGEKEAALAAAERPRDELARLCEQAEAAHRVLKNNKVAKPAEALKVREEAARLRIEAARAFAVAILEADAMEKAAAAYTEKQ